MEKSPKVRIDLSGRRFGKLISKSPTNSRYYDGSVIWECLCDCGGIKLVSSKHLLAGSTKSCGCSPVYKIDSNRKIKNCPKCNETKSIENFYKSKWAKDGHSNYCKICTSIINKNNGIKYRNRINKKSNEKYHQNLDYKIAHGMRNRVRLALLNNSKFGRTLELLGCTIPQLKIHLEDKFISPMTWDNYGDLWEIDHIKPCAYFDLSKKEQQELCFNYANLQPLFSKDNRTKGSLLNGVRYEYK